MPGHNAMTIIKLLASYYLLMVKQKGQHYAGPSIPCYCALLWGDGMPVDPHRFEVIPKREGREANTALVE